MFPLVSYANETCGFFRFIQKFKANIYNLKMLKSLQEFQAKILDFQEFIDLYMF